MYGTDVSHMVPLCLEPEPGSRTEADVEPLPVLMRGWLERALVPMILWPRRWIRARAIYLRSTVADVEPPLC